MVSVGLTSERMEASYQRRSSNEVDHSKYYPFVVTCRNVSISLLAYRDRNQV